MLEFILDEALHHNQYILYICRGPAVSKPVRRKVSIPVKAKSSLKLKKAIALDLDTII